MTTHMLIKPDNKIQRFVRRSTSKGPQMAFYRNLLSWLDRYLDQLTGLSAMNYIGYCEPGSNEAEMMSDLNFISLRCRSCWPVR